MAVHAIKLINKNKIRAIYALANELSLVDKSSDTDTLHELVNNITGSKHISKLSQEQANMVIDKLKEFMKGPDRLTKTNSQKKKASSSRPGMASEGQISKIRALMYELMKYDTGEYGANMEKRLKGILKKYAGVDDVKFLSSARAWKVIESMKGMVENAKCGSES